MPHRTPCYRFTAGSRLPFRSRSRRMRILTMSRTAAFCVGLWADGRRSKSNRILNPARLVLTSRHSESDLPHSMLNLPGFSDPLVQNSRYKDGTTKAGSLAFSSVPYRALQCDRCLVLTTRSSRSAPFHGANAGSNPAGDAKSIPYRRTIYSPFSKRVGNPGFREPL